MKCAACSEETNKSEVSSTDLSRSTDWNDNSWFQIMLDRGFTNDMKTLPIACTSCPWEGVFKDYEVEYRSMTDGHWTAWSKTSSLFIRSHGIRLIDCFVFVGSPDKDAFKSHLRILRRKVRVNRSTRGAQTKGVPKDHRSLPAQGIWMQRLGKWLYLAWSKVAENYVREMRMDTRIVISNRAIHFSLEVSGSDNHHGLSESDVRWLLILRKEMTSVHI